MRRRKSHGSYRSRKRNRANGHPPASSLDLHTRRLRFEQLEARRLLSREPLTFASEAPSVDTEPATTLLRNLLVEDSDVSSFSGQVVFLDFDGAENVTYSGPVTVGPFDVPAFSLENVELAGQKDAVVVSTIDQLNAAFAPWSVTFTATPPAVGEYSTVYIGGNDGAFRKYGSFLGLAEGVDLGNLSRTDAAFVFSEEIIGSEATLRNNVSSLAAVVAHETAHLLGKRHVGDDVAAEPLDSIAFKNKSELDGAFPIHENITTEALGFIKEDVLLRITDRHEVVDKTQLLDSEAHFDNGFFESAFEQLNSYYRSAIIQADPAVFNPNLVAATFGEILHAVQDFYAHTNWVDLSIENDYFATTLVDQGLGFWPEYAPYSIIADGLAMLVQGEDETPITPLGPATLETDFRDVDNSGIDDHYIVRVNLPAGVSKYGIISGSLLGPVNDQVPNSVTVPHGYIDLPVIPDLGNDVPGLSKDRPFDEPGTFSDENLFAADPQKNALYEKARFLARAQTRHEYDRLLSLVADRYGSADHLVDAWRRNPTLIDILDTLKSGFAAIPPLIAGAASSASSAATASSQLVTAEAAGPQSSAAVASSATNTRPASSNSTSLLDGLSLDLPLIDKSFAELTNVADRLALPFQADIQNVVDLSGLRTALESIGLQVDYLSLAPDANDNFLVATYESTFAETTLLEDFGFQTGFDYFDSGVQGSFEGSQIEVGIEPVTMSVTFGVDVLDGAPSFYVSEDTAISVGGLSVAGVVGANMALRNLLDVDINGPVTGNLAGGLSFSDPDSDNKLRLDQFANFESIVATNLTGSINFDAHMKARLPVIGEINWDGDFGVSYANGSASTTVSLDNPTENIGLLLENGYKAIAGAFDLFGGADLFTELPVVDTGLGEILGLPDFLTGGGLGNSGFQINVSPEAIIDLINGNVVDMISFESSGGDNYSTGFSVPLLAAAVPIGPVPLTLTLSFETEIEAGWSYFVGFGVDTVGFYIDPGTSITASGSILAGLQADVSVAAIAGMEVTAGVGASVSVSAGLEDPDPRDGRIYLDELLAPNEPLGDALLDAMSINFGGEAFGFARGVVYFLFWDWEVFNERFTIASFGGDLSSNNRAPVANPNSQRNVTGRSPLGSGVLDDSLLQNGVLTINTQVGPQSGKPNTVSIADVGSGRTEVVWRGVGRRVYEPGEIQSIVYIGNEKKDTLFVDENIVVPVDAHGHGGRDLITVIDAPATIRGGAGNDILRGGSGMDQIWGGAGDDQISGGGNNDVLRGEGGNDRLEGDGGADQLFGGAGLDVLMGGAGSDTLLDGGAQNDVIYGGIGDDTLEGGSGRDILYGEQGMDTLRGGDQDDTLIGGANSDTLRGGAGNDTLFGDRGYADPTPSQTDGDDFLYGQAGNDRLFGEGGADLLEGDDDGQVGADLLVGDGGMDILYGRGGDDQLLGGADADQLMGGDGDDVLNGNQGPDVLFGDAGEDTLQVDFATADEDIDQMHGGLDRDQLAVVGTVHQVIVDGNPIIDSNVDDFIQIEQISGDDFRALNRDPVSGEVLQSFLFTLDSSLEGDIERLAIQGLGGNDRLEVLTGPLAGKNLTLDGGAGDDTLLGGQGRDTLLGGPGDDKLFGGDNVDALYGGDGRDVLEGGEGVDLIDAGPGGDLVSGGIGREVIRGGPGPDILIAGTGFYGSIISGGDGDDTIIGGSGIDWLDGDGGNDLIFGGDLGDLLTGGEGDDTLVGELGRDDIAGNEDNDVIYTHLNNEIRANVTYIHPEIEDLARLSLGPFAELTPDERDSRYDQLLAELPSLEAEKQSLEAIPPDQRTTEQAQRLAVVSDAVAINKLAQIDLDEYQSIYIDRAQGGPGDDTIYGSPNFDILLGGEGDDNIHFSGGYIAATGQGDIIKGEGHNDTLWFDGTEADDQIVIFSRADGMTGNRYASVDTNGDGIPEGLLQELTIERIGVRALAGDDLITVDFGSWADVEVEIDGGFGNDTIIAGPGDIDESTGLPVVTLQAKATLIGGAGNDELFGGLNDDVLQGDAGDDILWGGPRMDTIDGGPGNDYINGDYEYADVDESTPYGDDDILFGGLGHDVIHGGSDQRALWDDPVDPSRFGDDQLFGGAGNDALNAGEGDDYVVGGPDQDAIDSGLGNDSAVSEFDFNSYAQADSNIWQTLLSNAQPQLKANAASSSNWFNTSVARAPDNSFVVTWSTFSNVYFSRFDADGTLLGNRATRVNKSNANIQIFSRIAMAADGSFVITWTGNDRGNFDVYYRRFQADGTPIDQVDRLANKTTTNTQYAPAVAMAANGDFVITWYGNSSGNNDVYFRRFSKDGNALDSNDRRANQNTSGSQYLPAISAAPDGSFVIAWQGDNNGTLDIYYRRFFFLFGQAKDSTDQRANVFTQGRQIAPSIAVVPDGSFVTAWYGDALGTDDVYYRRFDADGDPKDAIEPRTHIATANRQQAPSVAAASDGSFVVAWDSDEEGGNFDVYAQLYNRFGDRLLPEKYRINQTATRDQRSPSVAMSQHGDFVVSWMTNQAGSSTFDYYARPFDATPPRVIDTSQVNTSQSLLLSFSEPMQDGGPGAVTDPANWQLFTNGHDIAPTTIQSISQDIDSESQRATASVVFTSRLFPGDYTLVARGALTDKSGRQLDGNADGISGDDYVEQFTIVPRPLPLGVEFEDSSIEIDDEQAQTIAVNPIDHSYIVVWQGPGTNVGETDIFARRYDADGSPLGIPFRVNTHTENDQTDAAIAMDANGNYVIVWDTIGPFTAGHVTYGRRFAADGTPKDAQQFPVYIQPDDESTRPSVAMKSDGDFVVAWKADVSTDGNELYAQRFSSDGFATGSQIHVNSRPPSAAQGGPNLAVDEAGNFLVTWHSIDVGASEVMARWFSADGTGDPVFRVNTTTGDMQDQPSVAMNSNGEFAVVWRNSIGSETDVYGQRYDSQRRPLGGEFRINDDMNGQQGLPNIAIDGDGNLIVVWAEIGSALGEGYSARWFDKWGNLLADEFRVTDAQGASGRQAIVDATPDGEFVVAWAKQDASGNSSIAAQRYTLQPPTVVEVAPSPSRDSIIVAFSQRMAESGAGSVLSAANWALRLPDGRYLIQDDPNIPGVDPFATVEQFSTISQAYNPVRGLWEVTVGLNTALPAGDYQFIARGSLRDAAGRRLDGDGDGVPSESYLASLYLALPGDFDFDLDADGYDFLLWQRGVGTQAPEATQGDGDADGDRDVDGDDLRIWQIQFAAGQGEVLGEFVDSGQRLDNSSSTDVELGDLDDDGDLDGFVTNHAGGMNQVWRNNGFGVFTMTQSLGNAATIGTGVALGKLDGDNHLDAFVTNFGSGNQVWINDGQGSFTDSGASLGSSDSDDVALGDLDDDGDLDAFVVNRGPNVVWHNDGTGTFTMGQELGNSRSEGVALGDLDDDGDLDAFIANLSNQPNRVWWNNGNGTFVDSGQSLGSGNTRSVELGYLDDDGDLDAFVTNFDQGSRVFLNNGDGTFVDSGQTLGTTRNYDVSLGDVDSDGDLDAFVARAGNEPGSYQPNQVWLNDGDGAFTDSSQVLGASRSWGVALGDLNDDSSMDAFVANFANQPNEVWINQPVGQNSVAVAGSLLISASSVVPTALPLESSVSTAGSIAPELVDAVMALELINRSAWRPNSAQELIIARPADGEARAKPESVSYLPAVDNYFHMSGGDEPFLASKDTDSTEEEPIDIRSTTLAIKSLNGLGSN